MASDLTDVVVYAPTSTGGLAEHVHYQATALTELGFHVEVIVASRAFLEGRNVPYQVTRILSPARKTRSRIFSGIRHLQAIRSNLQLAARVCAEKKCKLLLLESFFEYGSPYWCPVLTKLRDKDHVVIGANLHDPVRDFQVGPRFLHNYSIDRAYGALSFVLVHQSVPVESRMPKRIHCHEVPVGVYRTSRATVSGVGARSKLKIPQPMRVYLSFGFIRDNKNLDLFIKAMEAHKDVYLLVAGREQSVRNRPVAFYESLAKEYGVLDRVRFDTSFIPDEEVPLYFAAADTVLLTYSADFRSQSGVLNIAANYQKKVLASSGTSPLESSVKNFGLGQFVPPDDLEELRRALLPTELPEPNWDGYFQYASWTTNVQPIVQWISRSKGR